LLFFLSVLLHELSHSVVARRRGMKVRDIVLFVFGGVSELGSEPGSARTEFLMAFVGPLMSFAIGLASLAIWSLTKAVNQPVSAVAYYLFWVNMLLGAFNLIPGFPLDGGRVLRSIIWGITGDLQKATRWATQMGVFFAYAFIFVGIWQAFTGQFINGLWLAFIGWFLHSAAQGSYSSMVTKDLLSGHTVSELVNRDYPKIPQELSVDVLVHDYLLGQRRRCLPVMNGDRYVGLVTVHSVQAAPRERWQTMRVADVMIPVERVKTVFPKNDLWSALEEMTEEGVHQLAVAENGQFIGMLARDGVMGFLKMHAELKG
jgi:Zn-dependent protease/CBS domain-containing protein